MAVYSSDRVARVRLVLASVHALAGVVALLAAFILASGDDRAAGVFALVVAVLLLGAGGSALRLLGDAGRGAKIATVTTGVLCVLSGLLLAGTWLAFLLPLVGLGLLFLALLPDEVDA